MRYRPLGRRGAEVSELGFGCWGIGKQFWKGGDDEASRAALEEGLAQGINFLDTALVYGHGHSEKLIGEVLRGSSSTAIVASKVPPKNKRWPAAGTLEEAFPTDHMRRSVELSLANLQRDSIDLIQLHVWNPNWLSDFGWLDCLEELRLEGKIFRIGVSANDHDPDSVIKLVETGRIDSVQVIYNIFDQSPAARLFEACSENGVGVIARVPFDEGALTGTVTAQTRFPRKDWRNKYFEGKRRKEVVKRVERLKAYLGDAVETLPELALRFCLSHPAVSTVIPGMRSVKHVRANLKAISRGPLSPDLLAQLKRDSWDKNFYAGIH